MTERGMKVEEWRKWINERVEWRWLTVIIN